MVTIRHEFSKDLAAREALLDQVFGDARYTKASERLRVGRLPADGLSFTACDRGRLVGTVRLWHVSAGPEQPALLLGPLAVRPAHHGRGIGSSLMRHVLDAAWLARRQHLSARPQAPARRSGAAGNRRADADGAVSRLPAREVRGALRVARSEAAGGCRLIAADTTAPAHTCVWIRGHQEN